MSVVEVRLGDRTVMATLDGQFVRIEDQSFAITAIGRGLYRVSDGSKQWAVAVAGPPEDRWIFVDGRVARVEAGPPTPTARGRRRDKPRAEDFASPMPATVVHVLVEPGAKVGRGDTLVVLEAMKMELPIRTPRDGVVRAVHCQVGELVQPGVNLLDLE